MISKEVKKRIKEERLQVFDIGDEHEDYILYNYVTDDYYITNGQYVEPCPFGLELLVRRGVLEGSWIKV